MVARADVPSSSHQSVLGFSDVTVVAKGPVVVAASLAIVGAWPYGKLGKILALATDFCGSKTDIDERGTLQAHGQSQYEK